MADDRPRVLLAVLKARGPAHPADLVFHLAIRPRYEPFAVRLDIEPDLEAFRDAGKVRAYDETVNGRTVKVANDAVDVDRPTVAAAFNGPSTPNGSLTGERRSGSGLSRLESISASATPPLEARGLHRSLAKRR